MKGPPDQNAETPLWSREQKFQIAEAYKTARTNLMFSLRKDGCKCVAVSSPAPGEGRTTTAVHLAVSLARTDSKVLLIDADLRQPAVHRFFQFGRSPGLTDCLGRTENLKDTLRVTESPNLSVICAGAEVLNPSELLAGEGTASLLTWLKARYDYIVLDTPPLNLVADALPLIRLCDGAVLVVRQGVSAYPELNKAIQSLEMADAKILGLILNAVPPKSKKEDRHGAREYGSGK